VFTYKALNTRHLPVSGVVAADTPRQARDLLRSQGLLVEGVTTGTDRVASKWRLGSGRRDVRKVPAFVRQLSTLLGAGVPLLDALDTIIKQYRGRFRSTLLLLRDKVAAGSSLAEAMRQHSETFDELCVNITEVGEDSGTLEASLQRLAEFKDRSQQLKGKLTNALIYPAIVLSMAIAISLFLMSFVVPRILEPLLELGRPLPMPTRVVRAISNLLLDDWWLILLGTGILGFVLTAAYRTQRGRRLWHRMLLRLPVIGELARKQAIVRVAVVMSTLLKSGIVFVRALQIARRSTSNVVIQDALLACETAVGAGADIGQSLERTAAFPPMVVQIFAVGQQSGKLEEMLERLAVDYDREVEMTAQRLSSLLEPLMIVILGGIVLFIAMATMLPILEAGDVLG
jgi:type II secretory pathway component PulF